MALQMALAHPHIYIENDALENLEVEDITIECVAVVVVPRLARFFLKTPAPRQIAFRTSALPTSFILSAPASSTCTIGARRFVP